MNSHTKADAVYTGPDVPPSVFAPSKRQCRRDRKLRSFDQRAATLRAERDRYVRYAQAKYQQ